MTSRSLLFSRLLNFPLQNNARKRMIPQVMAGFPCFIQTTRTSPSNLGFLVFVKPLPRLAEGRSLYLGSRTTPTLVLVIHCLCCASRDIRILKQDIGGNLRHSDYESTL